MATFENQLSAEQNREIYEWVDTFELSKIKRHIGRDFADGAMLGEIMTTFYPDYIPLHSIQPKCSKKDRLENWEFLRRELKRENIPQD